MSCFAENNQVRNSYIKEVTYGTTPGTPSMQVVPFITSNTSLKKAIFEDPTIQPDSQVHFLRHGNKSVSGDAAFAYKALAFDDFLEALFYSAFSTGVLLIGNTQQSFTIESWNADKAIGRVFTGMLPSKMTITINSTGVVQSVFTFMGKDQSLEVTTPLDSSPTQPVSSQPFTHLSGTITKGGSPSAVITAITFTYDNQLTPNQILGSDTVACYSRGQVKVTGTITAMILDNSDRTSFTNEELFDVSVTLNDGTNSHTYDFPGVKYTGADETVSGNGSVPITLPFQALYDDTATSTVVLTKA